LEFVSEQNWVDLVNNLLHLLDDHVKVLLLVQGQRGYDIFRPDIDEHLENVNVINELWEARENDTAARLFEIA